MARTLGTCYMVPTSWKFIARLGHDDELRYIEVSSEKILVEKYPNFLSIASESVSLGFVRRSGDGEKSRIDISLPNFDLGFGTLMELMKIYAWNSAGEGVYSMEISRLSISRPGWVRLRIKLVGDKRDIEMQTRSLVTKHADKMIDLLLEAIPVVEASQSSSDQSHESSLPILPKAVETAQDEYVAQAMLILAKPEINWEVTPVRFNSFNKEIQSFNCQSFEEVEILAGELDQQALFSLIIGTTEHLPEIELALEEVQRGTLAGLLAEIKRRMAKAQAKAPGVFCLMKLRKRTSGYTLDIQANF